VNRTLHLIGGRLQTHALGRAAAIIGFQKLCLSKYTEVEEISHIDRTLRNYLEPFRPDRSFWTGSYVQEGARGE
jgi:hypothetical protein